jgi:hypothetical protein
LISFGPKLELSQTRDLISKSVIIAMEGNSCKVSL